MKSFSFRLIDRPFYHYITSKRQYQSHFCLFFTVTCYVCKVSKLIHKTTITPPPTKPVQFIFMQIIHKMIMIPSKSKYSKQSMIRYTTTQSLSVWGAISPR